MRQGLWVVVFGVVIGGIACGGSKPPSETDAGVDAGTPDAGKPDAGDAGSSTNCAPAGSRHQSFVPCGYTVSTASRLIVMGDSISAGYGTTSSVTPASEPVPYQGPVVTALTYYSLLDTNDNTIWSTETADSIDAEFKSTIQVVNVAVPGATTSSMISNPDQRSTLSSMLGSSVSGHSIAVITIGGNDLVAQLESDLEGDPGTLAANLANGISNVTAVINYLQDKTMFPDGVSIYLADVYDPSGGTGMLPAQCGKSFVGRAIAVTDPDAENALNEWQSAYFSLAAQMNFSIVDARGGFLTHQVVATDTYFYADCIHPNDTGHNELRNLFFEAVTVGSANPYMAPDD